MGIIMHISIVVPAESSSVLVWFVKWRKAQLLITAQAFSSKLCNFQATHMLLFQTLIQGSKLQSVNKEIYIRDIEGNINICL